MVKVSWVDSRQTCPWAPVTSDPDVLLSLHNISLGRPDDSRLFLRSNLTDLSHSVLPKTHPIILSSVVYLLSQRLWMQAGQPLTYCLSHPQFGHLCSGWKTSRRKGCGPVCIPSISCPFITPWYPGSPSSPQWTACPCPWGLTATVFGSVLTNTLGFPSDLAVCVPSRLLLELFVLFLVSAWNHGWRGVFAPTMASEAVHLFSICAEPS